MNKMHRRALALGLGLVLLLIASLFGSRVLTPGAAGIVASNSDAPQPTSPASPGGTGEESAGAPASSGLAFQLDSAGSTGEIKNDYQQGSPTTHGPAGSNSGKGLGSGNFDDVLFMTAASGIGGGFSPFAGGPGSGGGPGGGFPGSGDGPAHQNGPFSHGPGGPGDDSNGLISDPPPASGGTGPRGPFTGGDGAGSGPGNGGPGNSDGRGDGGGSGNGDGGGNPDRFFTGGEPSGSEGGPSIVPPIQTSAGKVPAPPTLVLVVGGVGLLLGAGKLRRPARKS
jgi:hypothetical protein